MWEVEGGIEIRGYAQSGVRSQDAVNKIRAYLESKEFLGLHTVPDERIASVAYFPNLPEIKRAYERYMNNENITRLPPAIREMEDRGVRIPSVMELEMAIRGGYDYGDDSVKRQGPSDTISQTIQEMGGTQTTLEELIEQYENGEREFDVNGKKYTIPLMKTEILDHLESLRSKWARGLTFEYDYMAIYDEIRAMNGRAMINLFYEYDSGMLFRDIFDYDSEGDNVNTRGIHSLKRDIVKASNS